VYLFLEYSLLQSTVSHDPSEITLIWGFDAQETFMIIMSVEKRFIAAWYFCGNCGTIGVTQSKGLGYDKKKRK